MNTMSNVITILAWSLLASFLPQDLLSDRFINHKGWNLPNPSKLILSKVEKRTYPGISSDIIVEYRQAKPEAEYTITNALCTPEGGCYPTIRVKEEVWSLTTYKAPEGEILCYRYHRLLRGPTRKYRIEAEKLHLSLMLADGGLTSFICDLDNDGVLESMIDVPYSDKEDESLLISILEFKLRCLKSAR